MRWSQWLRWLQQTPPEEEPQHKLERLMTAIESNDWAARLDAEVDLSRIVMNVSGAYTTDFMLAALRALAERANPHRLQQVPRSVYRLAMGCSVIYEAELIEAAAQACLARWQSRFGPDRQSEELLRPSSRQAVPATTLLRASQYHAPSPPQELLIPDLSEE